MQANEVESLKDEIKRKQNELRELEIRQKKENLSAIFKDLKEGNWYRVDTGSCDIYYFQYTKDTVYLNHDGEYVIINCPLHLKLTRASSEYGIVDYLYIPTEMFDRPSILSFANAKFREISEDYSLKNIYDDLKTLRGRLDALEAKLPEVAKTE